MLLPVPPNLRIRRVVQALLGVAAYGVGMGLMVASQLGLSPWQVLDQGIALRTSLSMGTITVLTGFLVLLGWIPLKERPGLGTILNVAVIGPVLDLTIHLLPESADLWQRIVMLLAGVLLTGLATGVYIGAGLGPGPRDGLMTGFARRGIAVRRVRTIIELVVLAVGWLLGGTVGVGTVAFALLIGPVAQFALERWSVRP